MKRAVFALALAACGGSSDETCEIDGAMCKHLSSWSLFDDIGAQQPTAGVIPYDVNTPLFSDYASKDRFVRLPEGQQAHWNADGVIDLPVGSVLVKTFSYLHDRRDPSLVCRIMPRPPQRAVRRSSAIERRSYSRIEPRRSPDS